MRRVSKNARHGHGGWPTLIVARPRHGCPTLRAFRRVGTRARTPTLVPALFSISDHSTSIPLSAAHGAALALLLPKCTPAHCSSAIVRESVPGRASPGCRACSGFSPRSSPDSTPQSRKISVARHAPALSSSPTSCPVPGNEAASSCAIVLARIAA